MEIYILRNKNSFLVYLYVYVVPIGINDGIGGQYRIKLKEETIWKNP